MVHSMIIIVVLLYCVCIFVVLDPALIGLSLAYGVSLTGILQYAVYLSTEVESLVRIISVHDMYDGICVYVCLLNEIL